MLVEVGGFSTSAAQSAALIDHVRADMKALGGTDRYAPGMRVGFTGDVAISAEETSALVEDLTLSSRAGRRHGADRPSSCSTAGAAASPRCSCRWRSATVYAFALASLPPFGITELNSNTAFLGSIIIGNGINFGIIQLARYVEARRHGETVEDSLALALWATRKGTLSAALAAGVAYASLVAMQFRGFRQFGVIGGLGMLLAWAATYRADAAAARLARPRAASRPSRACKSRGLMTFVARAVARPAAHLRGGRDGADAARGLGGARLRARPAGVRLLAPAPRATPGRPARATGARRWTRCSTAT